MAKVKVARVYISEKQGKLQGIIDYLHDEIQVRGMTVFRGITGFGEHKRLHTIHLVDLSLDLPLTLEFFDDPGKIDRIIEHLQQQIAPQHIITWEAECY